jgi:hypothetical protein
MLMSIVWAALRRRPFSFVCTLMLGIVWAALSGVTVPVALLVWVLASLGTIELALVLEPRLLERAGCRVLLPEEQARLDPIINRLQVGVRIVDDHRPWLGNGLRTVVISRGALDLLPDRALLGLLTQASYQVNDGVAVRELIVRLGNLPLLALWRVTTGLHLLARLLAMTVCSALLVPLLIWPGVIVWLGRLLGLIVVLLVGSALIAGGVPGAGLMLVLSGWLVPGLRALLDWEARAAQASADRATVQANLRQPLLEALEHLAGADEVRLPGWLGIVVRTHSSYSRRLERLATGAA